MTQFITELLAGDLLENPSDDQLVATAFNRMHPLSNEGGAIRAELTYNYQGRRFRLTDVHGHVVQSILT